MSVASNAAAAAAAAACAMCGFAEPYMAAAAAARAEFSGAPCAGRLAGPS